MQHVEPRRKEPRAPTCLHSHPPALTLCPARLVCSWSSIWVSVASSLQYASPGYELLGLALCQVQGCAHYTDLDLKGVLRRNHLYDKYNGTTFPENGKCSDDPMIVHQYELNTTLNNEGRLQAAHQDIDGYSCLNGWSCGSIAASVPDVANWFWDVFHGKLVNVRPLWHCF